MTLQEIHKRLEEFEVHMASLGFVKPEISLRVSTSNWGAVYVTIHYYKSKSSNAYENRVTAVVSVTSKEFFDNNVTFEDMWELTKKKIAEQKTPDDIKRDELLELTSKALDLSKEIGIEEVVLAQLRAVMKHLSENVITHDDLFKTETHEAI